jgi:hypothetical protein
MPLNLKRTLTGAFETSKKATLVGPKGERVAVEVNSPQAKTYFSKGYTLEEKPPVNPGTVTSGGISPGSSPMLPQGSITTTQDNPMMASYNSLMMDSLKKAQGVDTVELLKRQRELQRKAIAARTADAPAGYETMSPTQQNQIRNSNVSLIEKEIDDNAYQLARAEKAISNFESTFANAQKYGEEFAKNMTVPESMIQNYKIAIETNPDNMDKLLSTLNDKSKQAVINSLDWNKISTTSDDKEMVKGLIKSYPDAGISPSDTLVVAQRKILDSKIYKKETKVTGSGAGTGEEKLTTEEKAFQSDLTKGLQDLSTGDRDWGQVWNYMYSRYKTPPEILDQLLNKEMFYPKE